MTTLLLHFDYKPMLEFKDDESVIVGLAPSHASILFTDSTGARYRAVAPPAVVCLKISEEERRAHLGGKQAVRAAGLELLWKVMQDFNARPRMILEGMWLATRAKEPPSMATYARRMAVTLESQEPKEVLAAQICDAQSAIRMQIEIAKGYNDHTRLANIQKGIETLRKALEIDAKTAMSVLDGNRRDFERERIEGHGNALETPFGRTHAVDMGSLKPSFGQPGGMVELPDDLAEGMIQEP
jgi:hypothetical protein